MSSTRTRQAMIIGGGVLFAVAAEAAPTPKLGDKCARDGTQAVGVRTTTYTCVKGAWSAGMEGTLPTTANEVPCKEGATKQVQSSSDLLCQSGAWVLPYAPGFVGITRVRERDGRGRQVRRRSRRKADPGTVA